GRWFDPSLGSHLPAFPSPRRRLPHILLLHRLLARVFLGLVMADGAAGGGAEQAVMPGIVAGDPADDRTLDAAFGLRRGARCHNGADGRGGNHKQREFFHRTLLSGLNCVRLKRRERTVCSAAFRRRGSLRAAVPTRVAPPIRPGPKSCPTSAPSPPTSTNSTWCRPISTAARTAKRCSSSSCAVCRRGAASCSRPGSATRSIISRR